MNETAPARVAILLSTFNGARFLPALLDSLRSQTEPDWHLFWRDDGSSDDTVALLRAFAPERSTELAGGSRLGPAGSFYALLDAAAPLGIPVAFSDQDDVWLPDKIARGRAALASARAPALYCSRQMLVDESLGPLGLSAPFRRAPTFAGALTGNVATGCTVMLDPAAATLVARSRKPQRTLHDWWSLLLVSGAGGTVIADPEPSVLYRQHGANQIGAPATRRHRALAALRRGPDAFLAMLRDNVAALRQADTLTPEARRVVLLIDAALRGGLPARLRALALPGLRRQTAMETALFRFWLLRG